MKLAQDKSRNSQDSVVENTRSSRTTFLTFLSGPNKGQNYKLPPSKTISVGRGNGVDIQILDKGLSRCHANIFFRDGVAHIEDLKSTNGTYVNKKKQLDVVELKHGDKIFLGSETLAVLVVKEAEQTDGIVDESSGLTRDRLTNLYDKKACLACLHDVYGQATLDFSSFCILIIKVDNFDQIKDTFGTMGGDQVLEQVSKTLQSITRKEDVVCRFSEDEFAIICPEFSTFMGIKFAEFIRSKMENSKFVYKTYQIRITSSIGIANFPENDIKTDADLVEFAQDAMHHAEKSGNSTSMAK